jgi:DNA polymerase-1
MEENKRLIIIDGNALVHRAYHALPPLTTSNGKLINAVYGFLLVFFRAIKDFKPAYIAATFDLPVPTFRTGIYKEYKGKRPKAPDELYGQLPEVKKILQAMGIKIYEMAGFEADDVIGTIALMTQKQQIFPSVETIIVTGDLDTLQLIDKNTKVFTLRKGVRDAVLYDEKSVIERYGLGPERIVDFKALRGDPTDNIPGVFGIGEKTAAGLIKEFLTIENLYQSLENNSESSKKISDKIKEKLRNSKEEAFFSKVLAQIRKDVPIDFSLEECHLDHFDRQKTEEVLKEFEFFTLINRLSDIFPDKG